MTNETIHVDEIVELARSGQLRVRAFGETVTWGDGRAWAGLCTHDTLVGLVDALRAGAMRAYTDRDGIFVGPPNPAYVDGGAHG